MLCDQCKKSINIGKKDIDVIYEIINRELGEKTGVHVPFPSMEALMLEEQERSV